MSKHVYIIYKMFTNIKKKIVKFQPLPRYSRTEVQTIQNILFVASLRALCGKYLKTTETIDDRSLLFLKLGTNHDCDDMAITASAFFNRIMSTDFKKYVSKKNSLNANNYYDEYQVLKMHF